MCLLVKSKDKQVLTAEKDLTFYKVVKLVDEEKYYSYYKLDEIVFGKLKEDENKDEFVFYKSASDDFLYSIEEGGYHLFCHYADAVRFTRNTSKFSNPDTKVKVVEAIVPKGTKYVIGEFISYASGWVDSVVTKAVRYEKI